MTLRRPSSFDDRPDVVDQRAVDPRLAQVQGHGRGPQSPRALTKPVVGRGVELRDRANAPHPSTDHLLGQKERRELEVSNAEFPILVGSKGRLRNHRHDGARNEVPIRVQAEGKDRLDVQDVLGLLFFGPTSKLVLFCSGRLIMSAMGFCAAFASAAASFSCADKGVASSAAIRGVISVVVKRYRTTRFSLRLGRKDVLPVLLHVHHRPALGRCFVEALVETAD